MMNWYLVMLFLHISSVIVFVGGIFARQIVRAVAERTEDIHQFAALSQGAGRIENLMVIPGNMAVIASGVILALITHAPILGFLQGSSQNWLLVTNILLIVGLLLVPLVFLPKGKTFEPVLQDALAQGKVTPQLGDKLNDGVVRFAHQFEIISLIVIVFLMVFKPF